MRLAWFVLCVSVAAAVRQTHWGSLHAPSTANVFVYARGNELVASATSEMGANWVAVASYVPGRQRKSDFAELRVATSSAHADKTQMRAAGFAEGFVTAELISDYAHNMQQWLAGSTTRLDALTAWLLQQDTWTRQQIQLNQGKGDAFFDGLELLMQQFDGMVEGYAARRASASTDTSEAQLSPIDSTGFLLLNSFGDIDDLVEMMELQHQQEQDRNAAGTQQEQRQPQQPDVSRLASRWDTFTPVQAHAYISKRGHCSALIKVIPDLSDILIAHNTWWSYSAMLRLYKHYSLPVAHKAVKSKAMSFSSYPGTLSSIDDFYILGDTHLVVTETSNNVYDTSLYALATNQAAMSWHRTRVANMLATDGATWAKYIATHLSGTYNNQYMVVDLKRFEPYAELKDGLLTVVETIPGRAVAADTTQQLERGYWPSYNVPYFPEVYNATGYGMLRQHLASRGSQFSPAAAGLSYQLAPRAQLYRRDSGPVTSLESLKTLMRSNGWPKDSLSTNPWNAISARGDLSPDPEGRDASGAYDAKVTNYRMALKMSAEAVNGPAWGPGLPPFDWRDWEKENGVKVAHRGMRDVMDTEWEVQQP